MNSRVVRRFLVPTAALSLGCGLQAHAATLHVPGQYPTIQQAIDASHSGDVVRVAPGTYFESLSIFSKGDLALESEAGPEKTIIDGGTAMFVICAASSIVTCGRVGADVEPEGALEDRRIGDDAKAPAASEDDADPPKRDHTIRIAGFTIRHGNDGIFVRHCRAEIQDNILTGIGKNHTGYLYGAVYAIRSSGTIRRNLIADDFGGITVSRPRELRIEDNVVARNVAWGMEISAPYSSVRRVSVLRNVISGNGSRAMHITGPLDLLAEDNLVIDNGASVNSILFLGKDSNDKPAPISGRFVNNTVVGSLSNYDVVGFVGTVSGLEFANNVVYGPGNAPAINCESYDAKPNFHHDDAFAAGGNAVAGYCVQEYETGEGNLSVDPRFAGGHDWLKWRLAPDSPLIDAGSNDAAKGLARDFLFHPRVMDGGKGPVVDIGAFESRARP